MKRRGFLGALIGLIVLPKWLPDLKPLPTFEGITTACHYPPVGLREDLSNVIYNISPDATPFFTLSGLTQGRSTLHEWQSDSLT